ncbi:MAG: hypothetical protein AAB624_01830 [Patescibacteria group bacterium]
MKTKDWGTIGVVVIIAGIVSFAVSNLFLGGKHAPRLKVEVVEPISADFPLPNTKYFNEDSINPTQEIKIGEDSNSTPFNGL